jgi:crossover junction endodeoxyribonuclease RusA
MPITFPFRMILAGPPVSVNSRDSQRLSQWKLLVAAHARPRIGTAPPTTEACCFSIGNYFERGGEPDADNIIKPVQDALQQIVYANDRQVVDSLGYKRDLRAGIRFRLEDPALPAALRTNLPFVHVQVSLATNPHFERL